MFKALYALLKNLLGESFARVLSGAGLSLVSYAALTPLILAALNAAASAIAGVGGDILQLVALSGLSEALSAIGSAIMTRTAIAAASTGIKRSAGASS